MKYKRDLVIIITFLILIFISTQSPILELTEVSLAGHMILEHLFFFLIGALSVMLGEIVLKSLLILTSASRNDNSKNYDGFTKNRFENDKDISPTNQPLVRLNILAKWKYLLSKVFSINRPGYRYIWIIISVFILAIWHVPSIFDYAEQHIQVHIAQHLSFIIVGATGYLAIRSFGESFNLLLLLTLMCMMGFEGLLFSVTQTPAYTVYSLHDHNDAGTYMILISILILLIGFPAYLIHRALFHTQLASKRQNQQ
jgi:cytochrome c oxidase assembly factor CtaG